MNAPVKDFTKMVLNDYNLGGKSPALSVIVEAVQWALLRLDCDFWILLFLFFFNKAEQVFAIVTVAFLLLVLQKSAICGPYASGYEREFR